MSVKRYTTKRKVSFPHFFVEAENIPTEVNEDENGQDDIFM